MESASPKLSSGISVGALDGVLASRMSCRRAEVLMLDTSPVLASQFLIVHRSLALAPTVGAETGIDEAIDMAAWSPAARACRVSVPTTAFDASAHCAGDDDRIGYTSDDR